MAGELDAISDAAKRGAKVFVGAAYCCECHKGPFFTDRGFHNLGVPQIGLNVPTPPDWDQGRKRDILRARRHPFSRAFSEFSDAPDIGLEKWEGLLDESGNPIENPADEGAFRTPTLRNTARTGPYFHNGFAKTLREVIEFYNDGGGNDPSLYLGSKSPSIVPLGLLENEIDDLVAFLETLDGETLPLNLRRNPAAPRLRGAADSLYGVNAAADVKDTFISPLWNRPETALREVAIDLVIESELLDAAVEFTGDAPRAPTVVSVDSVGDGRHVVRLDPPVEPGQWAKITLRLQSIGPQMEGTVVIWVAHHPNDINRDGVVNIADATAFGEAFRGGEDPFLLDLNGDGRVDVRDATEFGHNWLGTVGVPVAWKGHQLPPKPE